MEASEENKYSSWNKGGRPALFETAEELQQSIHEYFNKGVSKRKVIVGKPPNQTVVELEVPTITGLCYYIGFESRQSFYDYEKRDGFSYTIKRARLFIEQEYEEQLSVGNTVGAIFALKNMGWADRSLQELTGKDGSDLFQAKTDDELKILLKETLSKISE